MRAKKHLGQNFLTDEVVIEQIVQIILASAHQHVIEIGPGQGAITQHLADHVERLELVELDKDLIPKLQRQFAEKSSVQIHHMDALRLELEEPVDQITGNLPYNISTPLLIRFLFQNACIPRMVFMLQKEVVQRICAEPHSKAYGRLSVMLQHYYEASGLLSIPPHAFDPIPKVDSQILLLSRKQQVPNIQLSQLEKLVKLAFAQRRKTIKNNLKTLFNAEQLIDLDIKPSDRAENLSVADYQRLCQHMPS